MKEAEVRVLLRQYEKHRVHEIDDSHPEDERTIKYRVGSVLGLWKTWHLIRGRSTNLNASARVQVSPPEFDSPGKEPHVRGHLVDFGRE